MEWITVNADTVEQARDLAIEELGVLAEEVEIEVLTVPHAGGFLRRGRTQARLRARLALRGSEHRPAWRDRRRHKPRKGSEKKPRSRSGKSGKSGRHKPEQRKSEGRKPSQSGAKKPSTESSKPTNSKPENSKAERTGSTGTESAKAGSAKSGKPARGSNQGAVDKQSAPVKRRIRTPSPRVQPTQAQPKSAKPEQSQPNKPPANPTAPTKRTRRLG